MKNKKTLKVIITVISLALIVAAIFSVNVFADEGIDYTKKESYLKYIKGYTFWGSQSELKYVDDMAFVYVPKSKTESAHYNLVAYGVTKKIREKMTEINIPSEIDGTPVTVISVLTEFNPDYGDCFVYDVYPNVTKITIPNSITKIYAGAFNGLTNIESIKLPDNLKMLGSCAFNSLSKITKITIPKGVTEISDFAFRNCTSLKKVVFEGDITNIGEEAFMRCSELKSITQCNSLTCIEERAFAGCKKLKYFYLPSTLKRIEGAAFEESGLTSVTIPSTTNLVSGAWDDGEMFKNCKLLKSVVFEDRKDKLYLEDECFSGCSALETVVLPSSAKSIEISYRAFKNCTKLKNLVNTGDITEVKDAAFAFCKNLTSINFSSKLKEVSTKAFYGCTNLSSVKFANKDKLPIQGDSKKFAAKTFYRTPENIKFYVKNDKIAKDLKTALKGTGVKNAKIYIQQSGKLAYKVAK